MRDAGARIGIGVRRADEQRKEKEGRRRGEREEEPHEESDPERHPGGHLTVYYYGSRTGAAAESFARILVREGESDRGFKVRAADLEDAAGDDPIDRLPDERRRDSEGRSRAVFLMATCGEGEPAFVRLLRAKAGAKPPRDGASTGENFAEEKKGEGDDEDDEPGSDGADPARLKGPDYAVFGPGDRQYERFDATGVFADDALGEAGGRRVAALGVGDDDDDLEEDFENRKDDVLWPALEKEYVGDKADKVEHHGDELPECPYVAEYIEATDEDGSQFEDATEEEEITASGSSRSSNGTEEGTTNDMGSDIAFDIADGCNKQGEGAEPRQNEEVEDTVTENGTTHKVTTPAVTASSAATTELREWLHRLDINGSNTGRFIAYASAFEREFDSLDDLALAAADAQENKTWGEFFESCGVRRVGDRARIKFEASKLPKPE